MNNKIDKNKFLPYLAFFNICFLWGTSNLATKIGVGGLNVTVFACLRYLITGSILIIYALISRKKFPRKPKEWGILFVIAVLMNFCTNGLVVLGNKYVDSGIATMILATIPIYATIIECFILKRYKISKMGWFGLIGGFIGIGVIVFGGSSLSVGSISIKGICILMLGSLFWSIGSIYSKERVVEGSIIVHVGIEALMASTLFFITGNLLGEFDLSMVNKVTILPVIYLAIEDSLIGFLSYYYLLKIWKPSKVCAYAYVNPVVALILGAIVLHEVITFNKVIGMIVIIISVILIQKDKGDK